MPPPPMEGMGASFLGFSATMASVVMSKEATEEAPPKKQGAQQSGKKKISGELAPPSDSYPGLVALLQSDMLNFKNILQENYSMSS